MSDSSATDDLVQRLQAFMQPGQWYLTHTLLNRVRCTRQELAAVIEQYKDRFDSYYHRGCGCKDIFSITVNGEKANKVRRKSA